MVQQKNFDRDYELHPPRNDAEAQAHVDIREVCRKHAELLDKLVPPGRERSVMHTKLEEAMFWANAGVARERAPHKHGGM